MDEQYKEIARVTIRVIENKKGMMLTDRKLQFAYSTKPDLASQFNKLNLFKTLLTEMEIEKSKLLEEIKELEIRTTADRKI